MADDLLSPGIRRVVKTGTSLSPLDQEMVGSLSMQLRWTVQDQLDLRRIAAILRHYANRLEVISDPRRYDERSALMMARTERKFTQNKLAREPRNR